MQVAIAGQHIKLGASLQEHVRERSKEIVMRYFEHAPSAHVHFDKEGHFYKCDILVNEGADANVIIKADGDSHDIYSSFDIALTKVEKRLRKYKSKLNSKSHRVKISDLEALKATKYTICHEQFVVEDDQPSGPAIIAENQISVPTVTVAQAVMILELENQVALMFNNSKTNRVNMVYIRKDGNIAWVDSK